MGRMMWKNLLKIYLFCRTEKTLLVSHKMNDMKKLWMNFQKLEAISINSPHYIVILHATQGYSWNNRLITVLTWWQRWSTAPVCDQTVFHPSPVPYASCSPDQQLQSDDLLCLQHVHAHILCLHDFTLCSQNKKVDCNQVTMWRTIS